jgi:tripartite ATP-independent transporter DctP family solute receptor
VNSRNAITVAIAAVVLFTCSPQQEAYRFRYSNTQPAGHPRSQSMEFFERELERRTGGRIEVENYFSGVLGGERELMDMVATGVLQGTRGGLFADASPKYSLFQLPFLVEDWDQALRLIYSDFTDGINQSARANGFHVPACGISQGFRAHTNNERPIRRPEDLSGLKMRVPPQEIYVATARAFGANPQEIAFVEVYQAIQTGVIDGQDNALSNIWDMRLHEVQKFLTITNYSTGPDPFLINLAWYEALPDDLKEILDEVARETIRFSDQLNRETEGDYLDRLSGEMEVSYVTGDELQRFRELAETVYEQFITKGYFSRTEVEEARRVARGEQ